MFGFRTAPFGRGSASRSGSPNRAWRSRGGRIQDGPVIRRRGTSTAATPLAAERAVAHAQTKSPWVEPGHNTASLLPAKAARRSRAKTTPSWAKPSLPAEVAPPAFAPAVSPCSPSGTRGRSCRAQRSVSRPSSAASLRNNSTPCVPRPRPAGRPNARRSPQARQPGGTPPAGSATGSPPASTRIPMPAAGTLTGPAG